MTTGCVFRGGQPDALWWLAGGGPDQGLQQLALVVRSLSYQSLVWGQFASQALGFCGAALTTSEATQRH